MLLIDCLCVFQWPRNSLMRWRGVGEEGRRGEGSRVSVGGSVSVC